MAYVLHKLGAKRNPSDTERSEQGRGFHRPRLALSPPRPELLPIAPHECCRRLEADADPAALVDKAHSAAMRRTTSSAVNIAAIAATLTRRFATHAIMGVERISTASVRFSGVIPEIDRLVPVAKSGDPLPGRHHNGVARGGAAPSCSRTLSRSQVAHDSTIFPCAIRKIKISDSSIFLLVGSNTRDAISNVPVCVPVNLRRVTTRSPSAIISSI